MLERVALRLESGGRRLLRGRLKKRMLHSSFWVHGAGEFDPSFMAASIFGFEPGRSNNPATTGGEGSEENDVGNRRHENKNSGKSRRSVNDIIQLDFLYPSKTLAFLRTLSSLRRDTCDMLPRTVFSRSCKRFYSSGTGPENPGLERVGIGGVTYSPEVGVDSSAPVVLNFRSFDEFRDSDERGRYDEVWHHYNVEKKQGDLEKQSDRRFWVIRYLRHSRRQVDWERIIYIIKELAIKDRQPRDYQKLVQAYIYLGRIDEALQALVDNIAYSHTSRDAGFEEVIGFYINKDRWDKALQLWKVLKKERPGRIEELKLNNVFREMEDYVPKIIDWVQQLPADSPFNGFVNRLLRGALEATTQPGKSLEEAMQFEVIWKAMEARGLRIQERDMKLIIFQLCRHKVYKRATEIYELYRELPPEKPTMALLDAALRAYRERLDFHGLQLVFDDFFHFGGQPDLQAYYLLMTEMARHGEAEVVKELLEQFIQRFNVPESRPFTHLLQAYTKRGELKEVVTWFNKLPEYGVSPSLECYNILINAYGRAHDVDAALQQVQRLLEANLTPDIYTFATLMTMAAERGDVENTEQLMDMAKECGIKPNHVMYLTMVSAYVEAGEMDRAEEVLWNVESDSKEPTTEIWNKVLSGYATLGNSEKLNSTYHRMQRAKVPFDGHTYAILMHSLTLIGNMDAAEKVLEIMDEEGIPPSSEHYATVMVGYMRKMDLNSVWRTFNKMLDKKISPSFMTQAVLLQASAFIEHANYRQHRTGTLFLESAEQILAQVTQRLDVLDLQSPDRVKSATPPWLFTPLISIYGKEGSVERSAEHYQRFLEIAEAQKPGGTTPSLKMYTAIMNAYMRANNFPAVRQIWELIKSLSRKLSMPADKSNPEAKVLWSRRHELCTPLSVYMLAMARAEDLDSIDEEISNLLEAGYDLDNNCWNNYVQTFTIAGQLYNAFQVCEEKLMPGWAARKSFYSQRRFDRRPFPNFYPFIRTLEALVMELDTLEKKWKGGDGEAAALIDVIRVVFPESWDVCKNMEGAVDRIEKERRFRHQKS
ncbi:hypothetical protein RUND412_010570 [Rhizina undulata]